MEKQIEKIIEFHSVFKQRFNTSPSFITGRESITRYKLGKEELEEYLDACADDDMVEILDALADQLYILLGTVIKHGLQDKIEDAFDLVHSNNMQKLGPDGVPIIREDGKILKPVGFEKVDLQQLFDGK